MGGFKKSAEKQNRRPGKHASLRAIFGVFTILLCVFTISLCFITTLLGVIFTTLRQIAENYTLSICERKRLHQALFTFIILY
jgi:Flp pilus assembly protein TadB